MRPGVVTAERSDSERPSDAANGLQDFQVNDGVILGVCSKDPGPIYVRERLVLALVMGRNDEYMPKAVMAKSSPTRFAPGAPRHVGIQ